MTALKVKAVNRGVLDLILARLARAGVEVDTINYRRLYVSIKDCLPDNVSDLVRDLQGEVFEDHQYDLTAAPTGIVIRASPDLTPEQYATSLRVLHDLWSSLGPKDGLEFVRPPNLLEAVLRQACADQGFELVKVDMVRTTACKILFRSDRIDKTACWTVEVEAETLVELPGAAIEALWAWVETRPWPAPSKQCGVCQRPMPRPGVDDDPRFCEFSPTGSCDAEQGAGSSG